MLYTAVCALAHGLMYKHINNRHAVSPSAGKYTACIYSCLSLCSCVCVCTSMQIYAQIHADVPMFMCVCGGGLDCSRARARLAWCLVPRLRFRGVWCTTFARVRERSCILQKLAPTSVRMQPRMFAVLHTLKLCTLKPLTDTQSRGPSTRSKRPPEKRPHPRGVTHRYQVYVENYIL